MANIRSLFGQRVRQIRLSKINMSQEKLAFDCDLHRTYISDIERGTRNVSLDNIEKIAKALQVQPKDLFDFTTINEMRQS
ncbi:MULTISPECIES: helix-turn-helix domain-containing protein [Bacillus]|uniref:helix-turn-helix domain-containing protein n=1 Tax=Bacillus TaxID=1386 RepID=UPI0005C58871|nr:helix-turn-helix transcriptional regulator [Bacillus subtilis]AMR45511.1 transcriptional regulator [Bacillus subtilis subsp. subtilis]MBG8577024.1 BamHI control element [Bacillus subtilis]MBG9624871.1 BamHI control element [Bacillus subtilis]MBO3637930.1 helix-turn-helix transcriptional regulator [Bacillus subtilis]MCF7608351.1 helix-turn-helix domain-containing protein [Bacillus subtilis]